MHTIRQWWFGDDKSIKEKNLENVYFYKIITSCAC